jgi:hypothetical protein
MAKNTTTDGGYKLVRYRIIGTYGLLMHNPAGMQRGGEGKMGAKKIPTPEEEAAASVYKLPTGQLYVKADAIRSAAIDAVKGRKIGKQFASRLFSSCLFITDEFCPLANGKPITTYEVDTRRAVVQGNGIMRSRALVRKWECEIELEYDPDFLSVENLTEALNLAGKTVGIGDYRPRPPKGKGGPYGRFRAELL